MWLQLFIVVVSYLVSAMLQPKVKPPKPAAFEDFDFPQAEEGTPEIIIFGDCWVSSWTVLGVGNYRSVAIRKKGGKK